MVDDANRDTIYKCVLLLVKTPHREVARNVAVAQLKIPEEQVESFLQEARSELIRAAAIHDNEEFGLSVATYRELISSAFKIKDYKEARANRQALDRLLGLYDRSAGTDADAEDPGTGDAELIREHLEPLGLAPPETPVVELARLAVSKIISLQCQLSSGETTNA